jgi:bifunctional UDP-N-acetylglucosamine pyrophosphorylase/glucosamine-1-phosphate N-acetyltransferase
VGAAGFSAKAVVVAPGMDAVESAAKRLDPGTDIVVQEEQLGTAHAVLAARAVVERTPQDVIVLFGDTPLLRPETLEGVRAALAGGADIVVLGFEAADPTGYGRLLLDDKGELAAIREHKDASEAERAVTLCNSGVMGFRAGMVEGLLERIGCRNAKGEYYLSDAIALGRGDGLKIVVKVCEEREVLGINSRAELAEAEAIAQERLRLAAMEAGATLIAPETVFFSHDTRLGRDVLVEPNVVFGLGVVVEDNATVRAFSHLDGAVVRHGAIIGPYARLRPGADIGPSAHIGNFVEVKNAVIEAGAKANHLSYLGDARVGAKANVGAGTITCNYDGFAKHRTDIGAGAFIGSNTALVAPVRIGDGAYVGSGSTISKDVPKDALALTRAPLEQREGWAARIRARRMRTKRSNTE